MQKKAFGDDQWGGGDKLSWCYVIIYCSLRCNIILTRCGGAVGVADGWLCLWSHRWNRKTEKVVYLLDVICFQCFDTVSWVAGRAPSLKKIEWLGAAWLSVCSDVQTCIWPSWCHCHSLSLASVKSRLVFTFLVLAHLGSPGQRAVKCVCVCVHRRAESVFQQMKSRFGIHSCQLLHINSSSCSVDDCTTADQEALPNPWSRFVSRRRGPDVSTQLVHFSATCLSTAIKLTAYREFL